MAKKDQKKRNKKSSEPEVSRALDWYHELKEETKESIFALIAILFGLLFLLSWLDLAGRFGQFAKGGITWLVGGAYLLLPFSLFVFGIMLLFSHRRRVVMSSAIGGTLIFFAILGLIDLGFANNAAGRVGHAVAFPLMTIFDTWGASLVLSVIFIVGSLVAFDFPIRRTKNTEEDEFPAVLPAEKTIAINDPAAKHVEESVEEVEDDVREVIAPPEKPKKPYRPIDTSYELPSLSLLEKDKGKPTSGDIKANANVIQRTLGEFGIPVEMGEVSVGPAVTQYTLKPAQGVKLARIGALQNDLALALAAHPLRMEAPIPGKSLVGIEIPNKAIAFVGLRGLLDDVGFQEASSLTFPLGRDVRGEIVYADIARMPHMLVAGSTGSGKSVAIHSLLVSLLYKNPPSNLKLLMIDPKRVELAHYHDIPHLLAPVVTKAKGAIKALRWAVQEMERRYDVLAAARARDIGSYNERTDEHMPYIVIIIDELADLMTSHAREIEASIVRIAQMARAVGIHLVLSTQRPSVEVITGLIKANITTRVAFQVASQIDSRTILDSMGAEKLLGHGDMLFLSGDSSRPKRIQGGYLSEKEIRKVTDFVREQGGEMLYEENFDEGSVTAGSGFGEDGDDDELYQEAYDIVIKSQKASASYLQRRLKVGYARAARLLDLLEQKGVIGPGNGAKPRDVLVSGDTFPTETIEQYEHH